MPLGTRWLCVHSPDSIVGTPPTRGTHLLMTRGTHSHPDQPHSDFPKSTRGALLLSRLPQGEAHDTHKHNIRTTATVHPDDRHTLSGYVCPDH